MDNLVFERAGRKVEKELISKSGETENNQDWSLEHLPTHQQHLYDVNRYTNKTSVKVNHPERHMF